MEYDEYLHAPKFDSLDEMDKFLERHKQLVVIQEESKTQIVLHLSEPLIRSLKIFYQKLRGKTYFKKGGSISQVIF